MRERFDRISSCSGLVDLLMTRVFEVFFAQKKFVLRDTNDILCTIMIRKRIKLMIQPICSYSGSEFINRKSHATESSIHQASRLSTFEQTIHLNLSADENFHKITINFQNNNFMGNIFFFFVSYNNSGMWLNMELPINWCVRAMDHRIEQEKQIIIMHKDKGKWNSNDQFCSSSPARNIASSFVSRLAFSLIF